MEGGKSQRARQGGETSSPAAHPALSTPLRAWMAAGIAGSWRCGWMAPRGWESRPSPLRGGHPLRSASAGRRWESPALAAAWSSICSTDEESVIPLARKPLIPGCGRVIRHGAESKPLPGGRCCGERAWAAGRSVSPHAISDLPPSAAYLCRLRAARARGSPAAPPLPWLSFLTSGIWIIISARGSFIAYSQWLKLSNQVREKGRALLGFP